MKWLLQLFVCLSASAATTHFWTNTPYADGALADGDTVLCYGTFGQGIELTNHNLTLTSTNGAMWSAATWASTNAVQNAQAKWCILKADPAIHGLTIRGLTFRATDNGMGLTTSNSFECMSLILDGSFEITDCAISNLYYRVESVECGGAPEGIVLGLNDGATGVSIHNNRLDMMGNCIVVSYSGNTTNCQIYSNTITRVSWGVALNTTSPGHAYNYRVWANNINHLENWNPMGGPCGGSYHSDCIIVNANDGGATNHSLRIDRNMLGPSVHVASGLLYVNPDDLYAFPSLMIANNILLLDDLTTSSAMLQVSSSNAIVACNTIVPSSGSLSKGAVVGVPEGSILNTLTAGISLGIAHAAGVYPTSSDYNVWNLILGGSMAWTPFVDFPTWQGLGFDAHSTTNGAALDSNYAPTAGDTVARGMGTNLTALAITEDFYGLSRPAVGPWTIGAIQNPSSSSVSILRAGNARSAP